MTRHFTIFRRRSPRCLSWYYPIWYLLLGALLLASLPSHAQNNVRWDLGTPGSIGAVTVSAGSIPVALGGVTLNWCNYPANAVPCTNFANTYPSQTSVTPCPTNTQIVLQGGSTCQATSDQFGNLGVWTQTGIYSYTLSVNGITYGPFTVFTANGAASGSVNNSGTAGATGYYANTGTSISPDKCTTDGNGNQTCNSYSTGGAGTGVLTYLNGVAPTAPASGKASTYVDSTTNNFTCLLNVGYCGYTGNMLKMIGGTNYHTVSINAAGTEMIFGGNGSSYAINYCNGTGHLSFNRDCISGTINTAAQSALDLHPGSSTVFNMDFYTGGGASSTPLQLSNTGISAFGLNNAYYLCTAQFPGTDAGLTSALSSALSNNNGGWVVIPPGCSVSVTSPHTIGSTTQSAGLLIQYGSTVNINETDGGTTFKLGYFSNLKCDLGALVNVPTTAVITDLVANLSQNGTQEAAYVDGCQLVAQSGATVSGAGVHFVALATNASIRNTVIFGFPNKGLWLQGITSGVTGDSSLLVDNIWASGGATSPPATAIPCAFTGDGTLAVGAITLQNSVCEHSGSAQPNIDIEGAGGTLLHAPHSMFFSNVYCESLAAQTGPCVKIRDSHEIEIHTLEQNGNGTNDLVQISQSGAGLTYNIGLTNLFTNQNGQNFINDSVCNRTVQTTISNDGLMHYEMPCATSQYFGTVTMASSTVSDTGGFGSSQTNGPSACETSFAATTLSTIATTTDTGLSCLPANSIIDAVVYRITTTITTAASFTIGDATTAARFCSTQNTLTAGTTGICFVQADQTGAAGPRQAAAAKVRVTTNVNPGAGVIRLIVYYHTWTAPTS